MRLAGVKGLLSAQIDPSLLASIKMIFNSEYQNLSYPDTEQIVVWMNENEDEFFAICKSYAHSTGASQNLLDALKSTPLILKSGKKSSVLHWVQKNSQVLLSKGGKETLTPDQTSELNSHWRATLIKNQKSIPQKTIEKLDNLIFPQHQIAILEIEELQMQVQLAWLDYHRAWEAANSWGITPAVSQSSTSCKADTVEEPETKRLRLDDSSGDGSRKRKCRRCGNRPESQKGDPCDINGKKCSFWKHPDVNKSSSEWDFSEIGKAYHKLNLHWLTWEIRVENGQKLSYSKPA